MANVWVGVGTALAVGFVAGIGVTLFVQSAAEPVAEPTREKLGKHLSRFPDLDDPSARLFRARRIVERGFDTGEETWSARSCGSNAVVVSTFGGYVSQTDVISEHGEQWFAGAYVGHMGGDQRVGDTDYFPCMVGPTAADD